MSNLSESFALRLHQAMERAGYPAKPSVLEREFNTRYWGKPMTLHGVRRWLRGETMPSNEKILVLADWLGLPPQDLGFGEDKMTKAGEDRLRSPAFGYQERELVEALLSLPVAQRRLVREVILTFARDAERERVKLSEIGESRRELRRAS